MELNCIKQPTATLARGIEILVIEEKNNHNLALRGVCAVSSRVISTLVFPIFLTLELIFKRIPKLIISIGTNKFEQKADKTLKFLYAIVPSFILGLYSPEGIPSFFLKRYPNPFEINPFGVEKVYSKRIEHPIEFPRTIEDVQTIVKEAAAEKVQVSVIGAGMSQGLQTVPLKTNGRVINTKFLNHISIDAEKNCVTVGAGATWEQVQLSLDKVNRSAIVKQASDTFSIGGSIGINCHGWAHGYGAISSTVRALKVIDADGRLRTLNRPRAGVSIENLTDDEKLFKCMFGTLGYFGIIVEATLDIVENDTLIEEMIEIDRDQFWEVYEKEILATNALLFGGRLVLDMLKGDPLRKICMVRYRIKEASKIAIQPMIIPEAAEGTRLERISLQLISRINIFFAKMIISNFWNHERIEMLSGKIFTRNEALHPPINAFMMLRNSNLHTQWLQEYFVEKERLPNFLRFLGAELKANNVRLINSTIRPVPKDEISILPYAEKERFGVVISFAQERSQKQIEKTKTWIENVNSYLAAENGIYYQAYMPFATREQFEKCYGKERIEKMRELKNYYDPNHVFGNGHTAKYYDK